MINYQKTENTLNTNQSHDEKVNSTKELSNELAKFSNLPSEDKKKGKATNYKGDNIDMDIDNISLGKVRMMNLSPSSGYSEQNYPRKYCRRKYKIPKSDIRGRSAFDSHLEVIKASIELKFTTGETQSLKNEIVDLIWEQKSEKFREKNTKLNTELNQMQSMMNTPREKIQNHTF